MRESADREAEATREQAIEQARAHVAAVSAVAAMLLERVGSMDGEVDALIESLRAGAGRLAVDLSAVEAGMGELYDAASGRAVAEEPQAAAFEAELREAIAPAGRGRADSRSCRNTTMPPPQEAAAAGDVDGARLIALNMALNGSHARRPSGTWPKTSSSRTAASSSTRSTRRSTAERRAACERLFAVIECS